MFVSVGTIPCPVCGRLYTMHRPAGFFSVNNAPRTMVEEPGMQWKLRCSACLQTFHCDVPWSELLKMSLNERPQHFRYEPSFMAYFFAVMAMTTWWVPLFGLAMALVILLGMRRAKNWMFVLGIVTTILSGIMSAIAIVFWISQAKAK